MGYISILRLGVSRFEGLRVESEHVMFTSSIERPHAVSSMMAIGLTQPALAFLILIGKQQTVNP